VAYTVQKVNYLNTTSQKDQINQNLTKIRTLLNTKQK